MIVLKHGDKDEYLDTTGQWTRRLEDARIFFNGLGVLAHCDGKRLNNVEAVYYFDDPKLRFALPLPELEAAVKTGVLAKN